MAFPLLPLLLPRFYFFALLFTSHRSPVSERLEQATKLLAKRDWGETRKRIFLGIFLIFLVYFSFSPDLALVYRGSRVLPR